MICDEDPLRRRPRESTARRKRQERCVWMARKMTEWPSKRGPITKIMPSDGCIGDTVPLAVGKWYEFHEFGWHMGNVGLILSDPIMETEPPAPPPSLPPLALIVPRLTIAITRCRIEGIIHPIIANRIVTTVGTIQFRSDTTEDQISLHSIGSYSHSMVPGGFEVTS